jgi:hypothetical protein
MDLDLLFQKRILPSLNTAINSKVLLHYYLTATHGWVGSLNERQRRPSLLRACLPMSDILVYIGPAE